MKKRNSRRFSHILRPDTSMPAGDTYRRFNKGAGNNAPRLVMPFGGLLLRMANRMPPEPRNKVIKDDKRERHAYELTAEQLRDLRKPGRMKYGELAALAKSFGIPLYYARSVREYRTYSKVFE